MGDLQDSLLGFWSDVVTVVSGIGIIDIIDILVVSYLIYHVARLVRETRAMQLVKGIGAIFLIYFVAQIVGLNSLSFLLQNILSIGITVLVILFQPELRRALEQLGRSKLGTFGKSTSPEDLIRKTGEMIDVLCESCTYLSERKTGALMVIERQTKLGEIIKTGTIIDAKISLEMVGNVFFHNAPLHDGAVVVRHQRLYAAGCFLPLSSNMEIGRELGTRHRAALGMSENSDAVVIVVSEETGAISVAVDSRLQRNLSAKNLYRLLTAKLIPAQPEEQEERNPLLFWRKKP